MYVDLETELAIYDMKSLSKIVTFEPSIYLTPGEVVIAGQPLSNIGSYVDFDANLILIHG